MPLPHSTKKGASKYPYEAARERFVEGVVGDDGVRDYPTLKRLSELLEIPPVRLRERSARDKWSDQKAAFQAHMEKVRQEKRAQDLAKEAVDVDAKALTVSKLGAQLVQARLGDMAQQLSKRTQAKKLYDAAVERGASAAELADMEFDPWAPHPVDARELQVLAQTATTWHALALKTLGEEPTQRVELSGPAGGPLDVRASVSERLLSDDPHRLHGLLVAMSRAQISTEQGGMMLLPAVEDDGD